MSLKVPKYGIVYLFAIVCILLRSGSPYSLAYQSQTLFLHVILTGIIVVWGVISIDSRNIKGSLLVCIAFFSISVLATMIGKNETYAYRIYQVQIMMSIDAFMIVSVLGFEKCRTLWIKVMRFITCCTLILYGFVKMGVGLPIITTSAGREYYTLFIVSQLVTDGRASGPFWEPSMFVVFMAFTLYFEIMFEQHQGKCRPFVVLEIITLFLAVSMSSVVLLVIIIYISMYQKISTQRKRLIFSFTTVLALFILITCGDAIVNALYAVFPSIFYKFVEKDISYLTRIYNPIGDILTMISHPFGVGMVNVESFVREAALPYIITTKGIISRTSTWSYYFAAFGIVAGLSVNLIWIVGIIRNTEYALLQKAAFFFFVLYTLTSVTLVNNQMYWILIVMIYMSTAQQGQPKKMSGRGVECTKSRCYRYE